MMLDYTFTLHGVSMKDVYKEFQEKFEIDDTLGIQGIKQKLIKCDRLEDDTYQYLWNSVMHMIVNSIALFVSTCNNYSLDAEEVISVSSSVSDTPKLTEQDNERNTTYCMLVERTYDCEDGAGLIVVLYSRMKEILMKEDMGQVYKILSVMMDQYEPLICAVKTGQLSFIRTDDELFAHMGALLLPKSYLNDVFYRSDDGDTFEKEDYVKGEYLDYRKTQPYIMESTGSVMGSVFTNYTQRDIKSHELDTYKKLYDGKRMFCIPLGNNIICEGKHLGDLYQCILSMHPLNTNKLDKKIGTIYIEHMGESNISFNGLYDTFKSTQGMKLYYKYEAEDDACREAARIMKLISPEIELDCDIERYRELKKIYIEGKDIDHPFYHIFTVGTCDNTHSVPYLPAYLTNNDLDISEKMLTVKVNHDHVVPGDMFKPFILPR